MLLLKWQHHWFGDLTNQPVSLHHFLVLFHELFQLSSVLPSYINDCVSGWILKLCNSNVLPYIRTPTSKRKKMTSFLSLFSPLHVDFHQSERFLVSVQPMGGEETLASVSVTPEEEASPNNVTKFWGKSVSTLTKNGFKAKSKEWLSSNHVVNLALRL